MTHLALLNEKQKNELSKTGWKSFITIILVLTFRIVVHSVIELEIHPSIRGGKSIRMGLIQMTFRMDF